MIDKVFDYVEEGLLWIVLSVAILLAFPVIVPAFCVGWLVNRASRNY